ncbi:MAG: histidine phosphatase family protein [Nitrolancea sp.]
MTEVIFVRHGQTRSNIERLLHGRTDEPLNVLGRWQAQRVAERISALGTMNALYSSPLSRARVTADQIAVRSGLVPRYHDDLAEFHFGDMEGFTIDGIQSHHPEIYAKMFDFADTSFRFPNGESRQEFHDRVIGAVREIIIRHTEHRLVVVAHEGVITSAVTQLTGVNPNDWTKYRVDNCSITTVRVNGSEMCEITCWNDIAHLDERGTL